MARPHPVHTERGFDRIVNFTDAVAAIAATLLILPLISRVSDLKGGSQVSVDTEIENVLLDGDTWLQVLWFVLTFWVIAQFWTGHHQIFERLKDYTPRLIVFVFIWLVGIVFLVFPAGLLNDASTTNYIAPMYFGGMVVITSASTLMANYIATQPQLLVEPEHAKKNSRLWLYPAYFALLGLLSQLEWVGEYALYAIPLIWFFGGFIDKHGPPPPAHTERGFDRLVNFSDAVIAIAITLLILPLIDVVSDATDGGDVGEVDTAALAKGFVFLLTFYVMAQFWLVNHRLFETLKGYSSRLMDLTFLWLIAMVFLAFPAGLQGFTDTPPKAAILLYFATMALICAVAYAIGVYAYRHKDLVTDPDRAAPSKQGLIFAGLFLAMGLSSLLIGVWCYLGFTLLFFIGRKSKTGQ